MSGCGHLKPCGSPDQHHRPFHSTCSRSSSSSTQKSYYNWLYKSPYKSSVCVCFYQTHTHDGGRGWREREGKPRKESKIYVQTQQTVQTFSLTSVANWELDNNTKKKQNKKDGRSRRTSVVTREKEKKRVDLIIIYRIQLS